jgi:hypothetical protein
MVSVILQFPSFFSWMTSHRLWSARELTTLIPDMDKASSWAGPRRQNRLRCGEAAVWLFAAIDPLLRAVDVFFPILDLHQAQLTQDVFARRSPMGNATTSGVLFLEIPDLLGKRSSGRSH